MSVSSWPLLLIFAIIGPGVLLSYGLVLKGASSQEIDDLFAGISGAARIPFAILPPCCAVAFCYSTYYLLFDIAATDTVVLGVAWESGGEALVCALYFLVIAPSCAWMPLTVKCLRAPAGGVGAVVAVLNVVGVAAIGLMVCALTQTGSAAVGSRYTLHCWATILFAGQTQVREREHLLRCRSRARAYVLADPQEVGLTGGRRPLRRSRTGSCGRGSSSG